MDRIDELLQRRAKLVNDSRAIADTAETEDRALNSEETQNYAALNTELDDIESRIAILKQTRDRQRSLAEQETHSATLNPFTSTGDPNDGTEERAYSAALDTYLRKGENSLSGDEIRTLNVGTTTAGGFLTTKSFSSTLVQQLELMSPIRQFATVLNTSTGNEILIPSVTSHGASVWVAEGVDKTVADEVFAQTSLKAFKNAMIIQVSWELLEDSAFNLESYIATALGKAIGRTEGTAFATGANNTTTTPKGLANQATVGVTTAGPTAITGDEIIDLIYSVLRPYRSNARFVMNDSVVGMVRKLKANNEYIWVDGSDNNITTGEPARLMGYPVEVDPNFPAATAGLIPIVFGDLSGYWIRDVDGIRIQRLNELYAVKNLVGFIGEHRTDGALVDTASVKSMKMHA